MTIQLLSRLAAPLTMRIHGSLPWALVLLSMAGAGAGTISTAQASPVHIEAPITISPEQYYHLALEAQSARDFPEMLRTLRLAGEGGSLPAQEMLAMVLITGGRLYGKTVRSDLCEARMWTRRAAAQDSEIAKFQLIFLNRLAQARLAADHCAAWDRTIRSGGTARDDMHSKHVRWPTYHLKRPRAHHKIP